MVRVPADDPILFFAATFNPSVSTQFPHKVHVTADQEFAWAFLAESLVTGGYGHVVAYDITQAETEAPQRLECLGRFTFEERDKIPGRTNGQGPHE